MGIAWPHTGSLTFLVFVAFVPFLIGEYYLFQRRLRSWRVFLYALVMFLIFNFITTQWIRFASGGGMLMAVGLNSILMSVFILGFHLVHRRYGNYWGYAALVSIWMAFEYCHYHWELSWPWLNLGNIFARHTGWVQWYEYTGVGGGTLWILLANLAIFHMLKKLYILNNSMRQCVKQLILALSVIILPILFSLLIYSNYAEKKNPVDVVVVQPNIDPYGDKFGNMTGEEQMIIFLRQAFLVADSTTDLIIGPETALPYSIEENKLTEAGEIELLYKVLERMPTTELLTGMSSHRVFKKGEVMPENARVYPDGFGVEYYNSALFIPKNNVPQVYHKCKLVLGVEKIPFAKMLPFLEDWALDLGGTVGSLGFEANPWKTFNSKNKAIRIAPSVCYESIYGEHMAGFITNSGANLLAVITNDGWWDETAGYQQHFDYARLTAISLRRTIAQSANTGTSGFIDQRGDVIASTPWWVATAIRKKINLNDEVTFYAAHGDYLYRAFSVLALFFAVLYFYAFFTGKNFVNKGEV